MNEISFTAGTGSILDIRVYPHINEEKNNIVYVTSSCGTLSIHEYLSKSTLTWKRKQAIQLGKRITAACSENLIDTSLYSSFIATATMDSPLNTNARVQVHSISSSGISNVPICNFVTSREKITALALSTVGTEALIAVGNEVSSYTISSLTRPDSPLFSSMNDGHGITDIQFWPYSHSTIVTTSYVFNVSNIF